ncbi:Ankyrin repeats (3 copies) [Anatilimnocola aggregata]|uniref:Ankyrin repeats (3 copies) n=1 Tax=Anatilimnocola aggregata TaxID=2528021 RepID=A0A517YKH5_9BACT|nr:ankyrin repeat domain-containing protein [Anatilimnocola aggregata]QDU30732.1 Ankyrin repeats (3 copies) [Anatilimnocola aggregata]
MRRTLLRAAIAVITIVVIASAVGGGYYYSLPTPHSPQLADQQGVVLDEATQAKLTEIVFQAARDDDAVTIAEYLKEGFTPNVRSPRGDTLLTVAAYHDSRQVMEQLLTQPTIELEGRNRMGLTAVAAAAFKGHDEALRLLLGHGAQVDSPNSTNQTAIMFAALAGRSSTVQLLKEAGANTARQDELGNSAASLASSQGADEVLEVLAK